MKTPIKHGRKTANNVRNFSIVKEDDKVVRMKPRTSGLPYMMERMASPIKRLKRTYFSSHTKNS
tara:strand:+ start:1075 stop:1266 length:192 start_codon:yes stop_codon:yes gene_type:complete